MGLTASVPNSPKATGKQSLSDDDVAALSRGFDPALVSDVVPIASGKAVLRHDRSQYRATIVGSSPNWLRYKAARLTAGRMFTAQECRDGARVTVIGPSILKSLFHADADTALRSSMKIGRLTFKVIGILGKNATGNGGSVAVSPLSVVRNSLLGGVRTVGEIGIVMTGKEAADAVNSQIGSILGPLHTPRKKTSSEQDFTTSTYQAAGVAVADRLIEFLFWTSCGLVALTAVVGTGALATVLMRARTSSSRSTVARLFGAGAVLAVAAGLPGAALGVAVVLTGAGQLVSVAPSLPPRLSPGTGLYPLALVLAIGSVAALDAAIRSRRPRPQHHPAAHETLVNQSVEPGRVEQVALASST
jgi:putative ABC transport system permease protein